MTALLVAAVMIAAPTSGNPVGIKRAIKTANRVAASAAGTWTRFEPGSAEYSRALETVKHSGAFDRPVKVPVRNFSVEVDARTGAITLKGIYEGINQDIREFYTAEESRRIQDFNRETRAIDARFRHHLREYYDSHGRHAYGDNHIVAEHTAERQRRETERQRFATDYGALALGRKRILESVHVETVIPPTLASTIDIKKLATKKKVLLTIQVDRFGFREGSEEIEYPVSVGNLSGETIDIDRSFLKKKPKRSPSPPALP